MENVPNKKIHSNYTSSLYVFARLTDVMAVVAGGYLSYLMRHGFDVALIQIPQNYIFVFLLSAFLSVIVFPWFDLYTSWRGQSIFAQIKAVVLAWSTVLILNIILMFLLKISAEFSRIWVTLWFFSSVLMILGIRVVTYAFLRFMRVKGFNHRRVLVYGGEELGRNVVRRMNSSTWTGFDIVALVDNDESLLGGSLFGVPIISEISDLNSYIEKNRIDELWLAIPFSDEKKVHEIVNSVSGNLVNVRFIPDLFGLSLLNHSITEIAGMTVVDLSTSPMEGVNKVIKVIEDKVIALVIIIVISPLLLIIALSIKLTSKDSVIFKQRRHGWDGKVINVYKFRSMKMDENFDDEITQAIRIDPRTTKLGAFLRRTSLDELPQFFNVLQGHMSIVGPRPHAISHNEHYKEIVDQYMLRHKVKPGITGWAQINGWRGETNTIEKMQKRVEFDLYYIENWSLWFDLKIIFLTIFKGFLNKNAY